MITDMVRAVNMNGSNYIYQFADFQYHDMPKDLEKIQNTPAHHILHIILNKFPLFQKHLLPFYWTGNIKITRAANESDYFPKTDEQINASFEVKINDDELTFTRQKIENPRR